MKQDEIKQMTIDITKSNLQEYYSLNIVAFSFAVPGAQGEGGGIYIITEEGRIYHTNIVWGDICIDDAFLICPPLKDCHFAVFGADKKPDGWNYHYMGAGNHLFIKDDIAKDVNKMSIGLKPVELYQQWKLIVMQALGISTE